MKTMIDLCSGFGGASAYQRAAGWRVVRVDIEPRVHPDIVADVHQLPIHLDYRPVLVWGSPTCTEYSRWDQRASLFQDQGAPDLGIWKAVEAAITMLNPLYWVIENVRGAQDWHGKATYHFGPYYLWTNIPLLAQLGHIWPSKASLCGGGATLRTAKRGRLPLVIGESIAAVLDAVVDQPKPLKNDETVTGA